jgi:MFS family permease
MNEYLSLLRENRNFRNLWLGSVVSQLGDWFNVIAAAELITRLTGSGLALSYLFLARFLPLFLLGPVAGVLADRFNRKHIMVLTDLLRAATVLCLLLVRSPDDLWLFYLLTVVQFSLSALFYPARSAVLPSVVEPSELIAANALDSLTWSTMLALGAFLGGVVAALFGAEAAFVADALSFLLSAFFLARIVLPTRTVAPRAAADAGRRFAFLDGFRYLLREPFILGVSLAKAGGSLAWGAINVLEVSYANDLFPLAGTRFQLTNGGSAALGLIYVFSGLGTGIGPLVMRRWLGDTPRRLVIGISLGFVLMTSGMWWMSTASSLGVILAATLVRTLGTGTLWVFSAALLQGSVPDQYRGRVFSFEFAALTLTQSVSTLAAGLLTDNRGLSPLEATAVMALVATAVTLLWLAFHLAYRKRLKAETLLLRVASGDGPDIEEHPQMPQVYSD